MLTLLPIRCLDVGAQETTGSITGKVLDPSGGTDALSAPWSKGGTYTAGNIVSGQVNFIPSSKLVASFRGGYNFSNYGSNYGIPNTTAIRYTAPNLTMSGIPDDLRRAAG